MVADRPPIAARRWKIGVIRISLIASGVVGAPDDRVARPKSRESWSKDAFHPH
jgi:hypothetical protein